MYLHNKQDPTIILSRARSVLSHNYIEVLIVDSNNADLCNIINVLKLDPIMKLASLFLSSIKEIGISREGAGGGGCCLWIRES